ncbi:MAG: glycosyltransferase, partial [Candidatus Entotheonellia bacterium]
MQDRDDILLSIVVPAYNEGRRIQATLGTARAALAELRLTRYEIIVADDASTDDTALLAAEEMARVVISGKRNIGATRNVGGAAARGRYLLFLDADTQLSADALAAMLQALERGAVGGGARLCWSEPTSWPAKLILALWNGCSQLLHTPAGSFFFVRSDVFRKVGGFNEGYYIAEELVLARQLKRVGRLVILRTPIAT